MSWCLGVLERSPALQGPSVDCAHLPDIGINESLGPVPKAGEITQSYGSHMIKRELPQKASIAVHEFPRRSVYLTLTIPEGRAAATWWTRERPLEPGAPMSWLALTVTGLSLTRDRQVDGKQQGKDMDCPTRPETRAAEAWPFFWDSRSE